MPPLLWGMLDDAFEAAARWLDEGEAICIARVVQTWGSSPRPVGSAMAVTRSGQMAGSVSAGCVEGAIVEAARECFRTGAPRLLEFGVTDERAWEVGLACGGRLEVLLERLG